MADTDHTLNTHVRTCPLCEATCGLALLVDGDTVVRVRGDRDDVFSKGFLCPKGSLLHHLHDDPDRLRVPQIKEADGSHRDATWDEAFAEIDRLITASRDEHGPASTTVYHGNPSVHGNAYLTGSVLGRMAGAVGRYSAGSMDQIAREIANGFLYGDPRAWTVPDIDRTDLLVLVGTNPVVSNGSLATAPDWPGRLDAIKERGGRVVVIDPRRTETAQRTGEWIPVVPGTDALLLAAIATTVFDEGLADLGAAGEYCDRVDELRKALGPFTADAVAERTGVPAETIRTLARDLSSTPRAVVYGRIGLQTHELGTVSSWLTDIVNIVTGHLDVVGGQMFSTPAAPVPFDAAAYPDGFRIGRFHSRVHGIAEARGDFPVAVLPDEILTPGEGQIRSLITLAGNPMLSAPGGERMAEALASLDCFVAVDYYRNESTQYADVILPPPGPLERSHFDLFFYALSIRNVVNWSDPLFESAGPSEEDIILRLVGLLTGAGPDADLAAVGDRLVALFLTRWFGEDAVDELVPTLDGVTVVERLTDALLRCGPYDLTLADLRANPHGIDLGPLKPTLPERLRTKNGRIDLLPPPIEADLDRLHERLATRRPRFSLIGRRHLRSNNSWMHNIRVLMKGRHDCTLMLHPEDAATVGVGAGDEASITSAAGTVVAPVELCDDLMPGVVCLPHGWGHDVDDLQVASTKPGVNSNILTDPSVIDPLSGACSVNGIPVELVAVTGSG